MQPFLSLVAPSRRLSVFVLGFVPGLLGFVFVELFSGLGLLFSVKEFS